MERHEVAYIAGFFDGEGSISLCWPKAGNGKRYLKLRVRIGQNQREVLDWVCSTVGAGSVLTEKKTYGTATKVMHRFVVTDVRAEEFLMTLLPYLRVKRAAAEDALEHVRKARVQRRA
jgi:hypothetical protein